MKNLFVVSILIAGALVIIVIVGGPITQRDIQKTQPINSKKLPAAPATPQDPPVPHGQITNFEECVKAGYPVMESYPEKCAVPGGKTFVRDLTKMEKTKDMGGEYEEDAELIVQ